VQKDFPAEYKPFLDENGIQHRVFDMEGTKKQAIPIQTMGAILRIVLNPRNYPLLLHCNHGRVRYSLPFINWDAKRGTLTPSQHRTGCVVAVIRKFHGWSLSSVLDEYRTYAEPKIRDCDVEYITAFNTMHLANLWPKETTFQFRFQRFYRATAFVFVILVIWLYSGSEMSLAASTPRPQPTA
jgi:tyrosine-protein phosphatase SIW14